LPTIAEAGRDPRLGGFDIGTWPGLHERIGLRCFGSEPGARQSGA